MLVELKKLLEQTNDRGDTAIAAELRATATACPALADHEEFCALLGSTCLTGGTLETMLCDMIWRCFRRAILGCEKPRVDDWDEASSGGNPMAVFPIWEDNEKSTKPKLLHIREYFAAYVDARRKGETLPSAADYLRSH
jgi:hypothetical protein